MLHHLAGANIQVANLVNHNCHPSRVWKNVFASLWEWIYSIISEIYFFIWAVTCDFQKCGILTSVDSDEPVLPLGKLRNSKWCLIRSLTFIEYSSDKQKLWSDCAYAQASLSLCWSHIPHWWKSHVTAHLGSWNVLKIIYVLQLKAQEKAMKYV